jgi:hypothetical protein
MRSRDDEQMWASDRHDGSTGSLRPGDPDELAVELARRRHDRTQRLAAATVRRLARTRGADLREAS